MDLALRLVVFDSIVAHEKQVSFDGTDICIPAGVELGLDEHQHVSTFQTNAAVCLSDPVELHDGDY